MSKRMAESYLDEAGERLESARRASGEGRYWTTVFYAQECVEYASKAVLGSLSVRYPPIHDVGSLIRGLKDDERLPRWFRGGCATASKIVTGLARLRVLARYGDQGGNIPPSELFDEREASGAVKDAEQVYELSRRFVEWWFGRGGK